MEIDGPNSPTAAPAAAETRPQHVVQCPSSRISKKVAARGRSRAREGLPMWQDILPSQPPRLQKLREALAALPREYWFAVDPSAGIDAALTLAGALGVTQDELEAQLAAARIFVADGGSTRAMREARLRQEYSAIRRLFGRKSGTGQSVTWLAFVDENSVDTLHVPEDQIRGEVLPPATSKVGLAPLPSKDPVPVASKKRGRPKLVRPTVVVDSNDEVSRPTVETDHALRALVMRKLRYTPVLRTIIISGEAPNQRHNARARVYNHTQVNANGKETRFYAVSSTTRDDLGASASSKRAKSLVNVLEESGVDLVQDFARIGKHKKQEFKEAAQLIGITIHGRLDAAVGLQILADVNLTWTQYKTLHSILIDAIHFALLPKENELREAMKAMESSTTFEMMELEGPLPKGLKVRPIVKSPVIRVASIDHVIEADISKRGVEGLVEHCTIPTRSKPRKPLPLPGEKPSYEAYKTAVEVWSVEAHEDGKDSPLKGKVLLKFSGDKGGLSVKFGVQMLGQKNPNKAETFRMIAEVFGAPDTYRNLEAAVFQHFRQDIRRISFDSAMVFASNKARELAVKIVPKTYFLDEEATPWAVDILAKANEAAELDAYDFEDPKRLIRVVLEKRLTGFVAVPPGIDLEESSSLRWMEFYPFETPLDVGTGVVVDVRPILAFWAADYEFIRTILGHQGASATHPCIWCLKTDTAIQTCGDAAEMRTFDHFSRCSAQFTRAGADAKAAAERSTTSKKVKEPKGTDYFNVTLNPLVADWDPMMCAVLFLHLFLGTFVKIYDLLIVDVQTELDPHGRTLLAHIKEIRELEAKILEKDTEIANLDAEAPRVQKAEDDHRKAAKAILGNGAGSKCKTYGSAKNSGWTGTKTRFDVARAHLKGAKVAKNEVTEIKQRLTLLRSEVDILKDSLDKLTEGTTLGDVMKAIKSFEESINVYRQAYQSGAFIGRHVQALLSNVYLFFATIVDAAASAAPDEALKSKAEAIRDKYMPLWLTLGRLMELLRAARVLADDEVAEVTTLCARYAQQFRTTFPDDHVALKIHLIEEHVAPFVTKWRSAGLFLEDAAESIHALCNKLARAYAGMRHPKHRCEAMWRRLALKQDPGVSQEVAKRQQRRSRG